MPGNSAKCSRVPLSFDDFTVVFLAHLKFLSQAMMAHDWSLTPPFISVSLGFELLRMLYQGFEYSPAPPVCTPICARFLDTLACSHRNIWVAYCHRCCCCSTTILYLLLCMYYSPILHISAYSDNLENKLLLAWVVFIRSLIKCTNTQDTYTTCLQMRIKL